MRDLTVYFDYGSPYAYLAWQRIVHIHPERYTDARIIWVPASAGHIFKVDGSRSNVTMPNQKRHLWADVKRWAALWDVPFAPPPDGTPGEMPVRSLDALRLHFAAQDQGPDAATRWMETVYPAYFRDRRDISDRAVLQALVDESGMDFPAAAADHAALKERLAQSTETAYRAGAPGVPYIVLEDEGFWGNDRLDWVEARLAGRMPAGT